MSEKDNIIQIKSINSRHPMAAIEFLKEFQDKVKEGYVVDLDVTNRMAPRFYPYAFVQMRLEEFVTEEVMEDSKPEEGTKGHLEILSKKDDMVKFAELVGVEIPEDKKQASAIKKYLMETLFSE